MALSPKKHRESGHLPPRGCVYFYAIIITKSYYEMNMGGALNKFRTFRKEWLRSVSEFVIGWQRLETKFL